MNHCPELGGKEAHNSHSGVCTTDAFASELSADYGTESLWVVSITQCSSLRPPTIVRLGMDWDSGNAEIAMEANNQQCP